MKRLLLRMLDWWDGIFNRFTLRRKKVVCDPSVKIHGRLGIYGRGRITIGKQVTINSRESANPGVSCNPRTVFSVPAGCLKIGDHVGMSGTAIFCADGITIGDYVLLGGGVQLMDSDAHSLDWEKRAQGGKQDAAVTKPIVIGDHVFVGAKAMILKGVTVGSRAVIGAGSVVTRDVPAGEIWAGNPARKIGTVPGKDCQNETAAPV